MGAETGRILSIVSLKKLTTDICKLKTQEVGEKEHPET